MARVDSGFLEVNKKPGYTSHDIVLQTRRILRNKKIGHSGTLDAPAAGLLVLGIGSATRLLRFITALPKMYTAELVLGKSTDTADDTGKVTGTQDMGDIGLDAIKSASQKFTGKIKQIPPMFSSKKIAGQRLYELARSGKSVERQPQEVEIYSLEISPQDLNENCQVLKLEVECSSGTYIRTLGEDIAVELGGLGHIRKLCRTAIGPFRLENSKTIEVSNIPNNATEKSEELKAAMIPMAKGMLSYPQYQPKNSKEIEAVKNGRVIPMPENLTPRNNASTNDTVSSVELPPVELPSVVSQNLDSEFCSIVDQADHLVAVCEIVGSQLQPKVVLS